MNAAQPQPRPVDTLSSSGRQCVPSEMALGERWRVTGGRGTGQQGHLCGALSATKEGIE